MLSNGKAPIKLCLLMLETGGGGPVEGYRDCTLCGNLKKNKVVFSVACQVHFVTIILTFVYLQCSSGLRVVGPPDAFCHWARNVLTRLSL